MDKIIDLLPLLDADEVATVHAEVHAARPRWTRRDPVHPFFTLGAASYLDARKGQFAHYQELARAATPSCGRPSAGFTNACARPCRTVVGSGGALRRAPRPPGFHVHLRDPELVIPPASIHFDQQFELVDWGRMGTAEGREQSR